MQDKYIEDFELCLKKKIIYLKPIYVRLVGNCTEILLKTGEKVTCPMPIGLCIKYLSEILFINQTAVRRYLRTKILKSKNLPLYLGREDIFIGIKTRKPIGKNDGALTFINFKYIEKIKDKEVYLGRYGVLECISKSETIKKNYIEARDFYYILSYDN